MEGDEKNLVFLIIKPQQFLMKNLLLLLTIAAAPIFAFAQAANTVTEEKLYTADGIEYGYTIRNVSKKEIGSKDFSRYEVTLYATNKDDCSRVILFNQGLVKEESEMSKLARYDCINATGARLTAKSGTTAAKAMYVTARVATKDAAGKTVTENQKVQIGYYLGAGATVEDNVIFIVPFNEKPDVKVRVINRASVL
jgi:hypothetical protein